MVADVTLNSFSSSGGCGFKFGVIIVASGHTARLLLAGLGSFPVLGVTFLCAGRHCYCDPAGDSCGDLSWLKSGLRWVLLSAFLLSYDNLYVLFRYASISICWVLSVCSESELRRFNWQSKAVSCEGAYTRNLIKIDQLLPPGSKRKAK